MRFMIMVKATKDTEQGAMPSPEVYAAMVDYHEQLARAGVLLDANGLRPSGAGWRITWSGGRKTVTDGPFTETRELLAGYTIIQVASVEEAREWARRFPNPHGADGEIELRQLYELEDLDGAAGLTDRLRALDISTQP